MRCFNLCMMTTSIELYTFILTLVTSMPFFKVTGEFEIKLFLSHFAVLNVSQQSINFSDR